MSGGYQKPHRWAWFLDRPGYVRFMIREMTSFVIAAYLVVFLLTLSRLGAGEAAFQEWVAALSSPLWIIAHVVMLAASVWHAVTWFNAVPQAVPIHLGEDRVPAVISAVIMGYGPWLTVSAVIAWWVLR